MMIVRIGIVGLLAAGTALAAPDLAEDIRAARSRVEALGHGYATEAEWREAVAGIDALRARALEAKDAAAVVETSLLTADLLGQMRGRWTDVVASLRAARRGLAGSQAPEVKRLYAAEAEALAKLGDRDALRELIAEYRASPHYAPEPFRYRGGQGRDVPLEVVRPAARGSDDLILTAMRRNIEQAMAAPGDAFPPFEWRDIDGRAVSPAALGARAVLVDFFPVGSVPWERTVPQLSRLYSDYSAAGFEIVGVAINRDAAGLVDLRRAHPEMAWPLVAADEARAAMKTLGLFGDAANYLIDADGRILGRNLQGAALVEAVKRALGPAR